MKKILIWLLLIVLAVPCVAMAQEDIVSCKQGDTFEVIFSLTPDSECPDGIMGQLEYDDEIFKPVSLDITMRRNKNGSMNAVVFMHGQTTSVSFQVNKYAPDGLYTIGIKVLEAAYANGAKTDKVQIKPVQIRIGSVPTQSMTSTLLPIPDPTAIPDKPNTYYHEKNKGDWLPEYQNTDISGNWAVYYGPGENYYRANNNKEIMDGGTCRIYGIENNWVLIRYELANGNTRIGYVKQEAIPSIGLNVPYLDLKYTTRQLKSQAKLTDDIAAAVNPIATLPEGMFVLFLGYVSEANITWAYIEVNVGGNFMRGFINASTLQ